MELREKKGKLIVSWVPGNHGAGGSTISIATGIALQHIANKRTLIVNMGSDRNFMEQYMKNDMKAGFSMDYLKSFDAGISAEHIRIYSSPVNEMLYILPHCKISKDISKVGECFYQSFLDKALEAFEIVIVDLETGLNREKEIFLEKADLILAVMNENEIMLQELFDEKCDLKAYAQSKKTLPLFNALHDSGDEPKELYRLNKKFGFSSSYGIAFDINANKAACMEGKFYSFLKRELNKKKTGCSLSIQIGELSRIILERLLISIDYTQENTSFMGMIFEKARLWGEADA